MKKGRENRKSFVELDAAIRHRKWQVKLASSYMLKIVELHIEEKTALIVALQSNSNQSGFSRERRNVHTIICFSLHACHCHQQSILYVDG